MNEAKMTRAEFEYQAAHAMTHGRESAARAADLAERAGVEWLPEAVEPVVGDLLTEHTRLVGDMGVVTNSSGIGQWDGSRKAWYLTTSDVEWTTDELIERGARIIYLPGSSSGEPEPEHVATVVTGGPEVAPMYRATCSCGWRYGEAYLNPAGAQNKASRHEREMNGSTA